MRKKIYLTFDDGVQEGTDEVLKVLSKNDIKASFFLVGINCFHMYMYERDQFNNKFQLLINNHLICNHTFSHALEFYSSYYENGVLINNKRISAFRDLTFNTKFFQWLLFKMNHRKCQMDNWFFRPPGRNILNDSDKNNLAILLSEIYNSHPSYPIMGWDLEWNMTFELSTFIREEVRKNHESKARFNPLQIINHTNEVLNQNVNFDRIKEKHQDVLEKIFRCPKDKIIILLHDRAFRFHPQIDFSEELDSLINKLKFLGYEFETLDKYYGQK